MKLTLDQRAEIALRYASGEARRSLATEFGITGPRVTQLARKNGMPRKNTPYKLTPEKRYELEKLIFAGVKYDAIAYQFGVHYSRVVAIAHRIGVFRRPRPQ
jgi:hypothetical protein